MIPLSADSPLAVYTHALWRVAVRLSRAMARGLSWPMRKLDEVCEFCDRT